MTSPIDTIWVLACAALVMSMQIGFCMLEAGLVRSKNSINVAIKNLIDFCVASLLFWAVGFGLMFGSSPTGWLGLSEFLGSFELDPQRICFFIFQLMFCATAATIVSGAVAERMSFAAYILVTIMVSGIVYPIGGGWAWNATGWLNQMGFHDFAGSTVVHSVGGWVSLAAVLILRPRTGRFDSKTALVSSHSLVISTFGVLVLFVGWLGFNGGSTLALNNRVPAILVNTTLAGSAGCLAALASVWWHKKLPELPATLNGCVGGLVAITAGCDVVGTPQAVLIGATGGAISYFAAIGLEKLKIDDVVGASAAHGFPGTWGTLAAGLFGKSELLGTDLSLGQQVGVQLIGISAFAVWAFGGGYLLLLIVNRIRPLRIQPEFEEVGLNVAEHGASTEIIDLLNEMARHSYKGEFSERLNFEPFTEVGQIASQYNLVIDKVVAEMELRENIASHLKRARDESEHANRKIFSSLQYARRIQHAMLPPTSLLKATLGEHFVVYEPRDLVSGDFYWCATTPSGRFCAVVDCTGHGVPGAFMSMIGYLLLERIVVEKNIGSPAEILAEMHRRVRQTLGQDSSEGAGNRDGMEIALIRIDKEGVTFAGAQRPLWWVSQNNDGIAEAGEIPGDRHGLGGGSMEPQVIAFTEHHVPRDDSLTFYLQSDGLVQQPNHLHAIYDRSRLRDLLVGLQSSSMATHARRIAASFHEFRGGATQRDDVTLLGVRPWSQMPESGSFVRNAPAIKEVELLSYTGPMSPEAINLCGKQIREQIALTASGRVSLFGLFVEIAQNVAQHSSEKQDGVGVGSVFVRRNGENLCFGSVNLMDNHAAELLEERLRELSAMEPEALKAEYLDRLHGRVGMNVHRGLGLIDLARKSLIFPESRFERIGDENFRFSISVTVRQNPSF